MTSRLFEVVYFVYFIGVHVSRKLVVIILDITKVSEAYVDFGFNSLTNLVDYVVYTSANCYHIRYKFTM